MTSSQQADPQAEVAYYRESVNKKTRETPSTV
jgi:hypothetical protein